MIIRRILQAHNSPPTTSPLPQKAYQPQEYDDASLTHSVRDGLTFHFNVLTSGSGLEYAHAHTHGNGNGNGNRNSFGRWLDNRYNNRYDFGYGHGHGCVLMAAARPFGLSTSNNLAFMMIAAKLSEQIPF